MIPHIWIVNPLYNEKTKNDRGNMPLSKLIYQTVYDLAHFLFASGVVGLVKNFLLLRFRHGRVGIQRGWVHGKGHAKANGDFVKIHVYTSLCDCVQHIFDEDPVAFRGVFDQHVGHGTDELTVLNDR